MNFCSFTHLSIINALFIKLIFPENLLYVAANQDSLTLSLGLGVIF